MTKGTPSMGRKSGKRRFVQRCRRCGKRSFHVRGEKRCAFCGYGETAKLRRYNWQSKRKGKKSKRIRHHNQYH